MIEVSALPAIAQLFGATAPQGEAGEEAPVSGQFAQLLSLRLGALPAGDEAPKTAALPAGSRPQPESVRSSGKPDGKTLPELPPLLPADVEALEAETAPIGEAALQESAVTPGQTPMPEVFAPQNGIIAPLVAAGAAPQAPLPEATKATVERTAKPLPEIFVALRLPARGSQVQTPEPGAPSALQLPQASLAQAQFPAVLARQPLEPASQPVQFVPLQAVAPSVVHSSSFAPLRLIPGKAEAGEASVAPVSAEPVSVIEPSAAARLPEVATSPFPATQPVAPLRRLGAETVEPVPAVPQSAAAETAAADAPLPILAQSGSSPFTPPTPEVASPQVASTAPAAVLSASTPATGSEAPRDFAQLIDRLAEAREAFRSAQAPQSVVAAIAHAEFGQVQLRFEQDGGALSVSLASPDPEFARAVQAAAPAGQQSMSQDNTATPQRSDPAGQQGSGAASGQPQSQQRGQAQAQQSTEPRERPAQPGEQPGEAKPPRRNSIFA